MTLSLQRFSLGDTNYIGKHNSNAEALEAKTNSIEAILAGITGVGALSLTSAYEALFGTTVAVIGATSYACSGASSTLTVEAGYCWRPTLLQVLHKASSTALSFAGLSAATYYIQIDSTGTPLRSNDSTEAIYSIVWDGAAFGTITRLANIAWGAGEWLAAQTSAALGAAYTTLDARLEAGEAKAVQGADFADLAGLANGVATLGADGKLDADQLPPLAVTEYLGTAADQTAMLALSGEKGDWCVRTDNAKVYLITGDDPSVLADWTALSYPTGSTGTVTSVDAANGVETAGGSAITTSGTIRANALLNAQTGTTYTLVTGDRGKLVTLSNASAIAATLPQAGINFPDGWFTDVKATGVGTVTVTPTTSTIDGGASLVLSSGQSARIVSDGTNYFTVGRSSGAAPQPGFGATYNGVPAASALLLHLPLPYAITFPASLTGSRGVAGTAATAQTDFDIQKNGASVGTMRFALGATTASFIMASPTSFAAGDVLKVIAPGTPDATLANLGFVLLGTR